MNNELSLGIKINNAQEELTLAIIDIQKRYQLPSYIIELIINSSLIDVKTCANREEIKEFLKEQVGDKEKNEK